MVQKPNSATSTRSCGPGTPACDSGQHTIAQSSAAITLTGVIEKFGSRRAMTMLKAKKPVINSASASPISRPDRAEPLTITATPASDTALAMRVRREGRSPVQANAMPAAKNGVIA